MEEPRPMWDIFPDLSADDVQNQGAVDAYIDHIFLPYWQSLSECLKAAYLDKHNATDDWRANIAKRYEWAGVDDEGDPIWRSPTWLKRQE